MGPRRGSLDAAASKQAHSNRSSAAHGDLFAGHRERMTALVLGLAPAGGAGRVCLLGAGNCNDFDLAALAGKYREIHLVDIDPSALDRAFGRAEAPVRARLRRHAPVELMGLLSAIDSWNAHSPLASEIDAHIAPAVKSVVAKIPGPFEVTVSCCVITQLSWALSSLLGEKPFLDPARKALITIHLRTLAALTVVGGTAVLASDIVSSEFYPLDEVPPDQDLKELFDRLNREGHVFFGADPLRLAQILRKDPELAARAVMPAFLDPWMWRMDPHRTFLVNALTFKRA